MKAVEKYMHFHVVRFVYQNIDFRLDFLFNFELDRFLEVIFATINVLFQRKPQNISLPR